MRCDGTRVRNVDSITALMPYFMKDRVDALNYTQLMLPFSPIRQYARKRRREGVPMTYMSIIIAAYTRVIAEFPALNRFIVHKKIYAHNDITVSLVVLKNGKTTDTDADDETMIKIHLDPTDTIDTVNEKVLRLVEESKDVEEENGLDRIMKVILSMSGLTSLLIKLLFFMDNHGLLPKSLVEVSPFHSSMVISNLASIRLGPVQHHIYNFGTVSEFVVLGQPVDKLEEKNGEIVNTSYLPFSITMDERIANGAYFGKAFHRFSSYLKNPSLLETPPEFEIKKDL